MLFVATSCSYLSEDATPTKSITNGYKPIYQTDDSWKVITFDEATDRNTNILGKPHYHDNHIYLLEDRKGIHIIDNTDPINPQALKFIQVQGVSDFIIKGNILYLDNYTDLVAINISDMNNMFVESRTEGLYPITQQLFPDGASGDFECVDSDRGIVLAWEFTTLENPQCRR